MLAVLIPAGRLENSGVIPSRMNQTERVERRPNAFEANGVPFVRADALG
jgi:hypothetical protein